MVKVCNDKPIKIQRKMCHRICAYCGSDFVSKTSRSKYCTEQCRREADKRNKRERYLLEHYPEGRECRACGKELSKNKSYYCNKACKNQYYNNAENSHGLLKKDCVWCGKEFSTYKSFAICCSSDCSDKYRSRHCSMIEWEQKQRDLVENKLKKEQEIAYREEKKLQEQQKLKLRRAKEKASKIIVLKVHNCGYCDKEFLSQYDDKVYCSKKCKRKQSKVISVEKNGNVTGRKTIKRVTSKEKYIDKNITVKRLYDRDEGICWLCGEKTDMSDIKYSIGRDGRKCAIVGGKYPSIDHVFPLSKGGIHSWSNVRLAHCKCNNLKRDKVI